MKQLNYFETNGDLEFSFTFDSKWQIKKLVLGKKIIGDDKELVTQNEEFISDWVFSTVRDLKICKEKGYIKPWIVDLLELSYQINLSEIPTSGTVWIIDIIKT